MGSPQNPTAEQIAALEKAGQLQQINETETLNSKNNAAQINNILTQTSCYFD